MSVRKLIQMTRKETMVQLEDLDEYFRIHGWCTQMNNKISTFMEQLTGRERKYVQDWAYATLERKNIKSASQIMAIILLKLLEVSDRELIRLLYTVLSGRLTFEDFNSLNTYIFRGKPPLSKDLFYNITERVFIDKKSAILKALSISSIISEADPDLTIFYMTMLLCRVDLNNENRAMLNLLLYCIDADIPEEVSGGVREYLLSIQDTLEEILSSENNTGIQRVLETVQANIGRKSGAPGIISIEKKTDKQENSSEENGRKEKPPVYTPERTLFHPPEEKEIPPVTHISPAGNRNTKHAGVEVEVTAVEEVEKTSAQTDVPLDTSSHRSPEIFPGSPGERSSDKIPYVTPETIAVGKDELMPDTGQVTDLVSEDALRSPPRGKKEKEEKTEKKAGSTPSLKETFTEGKEPAGLSGITENPVPPEKYELKLRKFKLSDLFTGRKTGKKIERETVKNINKTPVKTEKYKKDVHSVRHHPARILIWIAAAAAAAAVFGWFILKPHNPERAPVQVNSVKTTPISEPPRTVPRTTENPPISEWKLKETGRGIEWTVQKGESVWRLYEYLHSHVSELTEPLQSAGEMDWLPFIHQIIVLNPQKSFAEPIEPGEVFLVLRKR